MSDLLPAPMPHQMTKSLRRSVIRAMAFAESLNSELLDLNTELEVLGHRQRADAIKRTWVQLQKLVARVEEAAR